MLLALMFSAIQSYSQETKRDKFIEGGYKLESTKSAYFITTKHDTIECYLNDVAAKNIINLFTKNFSNFMFTRVGNGKKDTIDVANISEAFLPIIYNDKVLNTIFRTYSKVKLINPEITLMDRYVYLKNVVVTEDEKEEKMLLRLLNPTFCEKVQVYENPNASKKSVNGGREVPSSFYVSYAGKTVKVKRGNYKEIGKEMFKDCPKLFNMKRFIYEYMDGDIYENDKNMCE